MKIKRILAGALASLLVVTNVTVINAAEAVPEDTVISIRMTDDRGRDVDQYSIEIVNIETGAKGTYKSSGSTNVSAILGNKSTGAVLTSQASMGWSKSWYRITLETFDLPKDTEYWGLKIPDVTTFPLKKYSSSSFMAYRGASFSGTVEYSIKDCKETMTMPANTMMITNEYDHACIVKVNNDSVSVSSGSLLAPFSKTVSNKEAGEHKLMCGTTGSFTSMRTVNTSDKAKKYYYVTQKFSGLNYSVNENGYVRYPYGNQNPYIPVGKNSTLIGSFDQEETVYPMLAVISGSYIQFVKPDKDGNISYWLEEGTVEAKVECVFFGKNLGESSIGSINYTRKKDITFTTPKTTYYNGLNVVGLTEGTYRVHQTSEPKKGYLAASDVTFTVSKYSKPQEVITLVSKSKVVWGDADGDGVVDVRDAVLIKQYIANMPVSIDTVAADYNEDGVIDVVDAVMIMQIIAGIM